VGSVRGEKPTSHGGLTRARNWKRWKQPKNTYSSPALLYSEYRQSAPRGSTTRTLLRGGRRRKSTAALLRQKLRSRVLTPTDR